MEIQQAIRQLQKELNMKQSDLAYELGVSKVTVNRWVQKKSTPNRAMALALLNYAKAHGASTACVAALEGALFPTAVANGLDDLKYSGIEQINCLVNNSSNAIFVCDAKNWELLYINQQMSNMTGRPLEEAGTKKCYEYIFHRDSPCPDCRINCLTGDAFCTRKYQSPITGRRYITRSKNIEWNGRAAHIEYITDVTSLHEQESENAFWETGTALPDGKSQHTILIADDQVINRRILRRQLEQEYQILEAENGVEALEILRKNSAQVAAVLLDIVMPVLDGYGVLKAMRDEPALARIPVIVSSQKDGDAAELRALSLGAQDFIAKPYKADIIRHRLKNTIRLRETAALANRAEKDGLTGLLNKQFFLGQTTAVLRQTPEQQYDVLYFNIERFKLVNDTYGVATGDRLLCYVADLLREMPGALLTARFAGDHFYQLAPRTGTDIHARMNDFVAKVREFPIEMKLNVKCGVYQIQNLDHEVSGMCDRAKLAADIRRGRADAAVFFYDDSIRQKLLEEQFVTGSMRTALDEQQFQVYYQPKYDLHTEMVAGAEALVRWIHPEKGFMSPGAFIPIFEKNGFITQLDRYVWEQACKNIRAWMDEGLPPVPVSVNVSRADVFNPNLPDILLGLTQKYNVPIPYLHLEITESAYTDDPEQIIAVVGRLHNMGFVIEMDDFGSGYSSLNMLAELPVDILKLDMRFVQTETSNASGRGIMSFVISLAKWMKLSVIAEGVETAEQIETLRSMDCNFVQGFYYAKPMPRAEFENTLRTVAVTTLSTAAKVNLAAKKVAPPKPERVMLVVDDIEVNRAVLNDIFTGEYEVVEKENGQLALEYLQQNFKRVDIVLLDLLMPVMDGFQLLKKMKADENFNDIAIIVTSQGDVAAEERALDMGADDFISKPYSPQIVSHRVHNVVQVHQAHREQRQKLDETRARVHTLMDSIPGGVAIYHVKKDGRMTTEYVSDGLARLCGYTTEEFMARMETDACKNMVQEDVVRLLADVTASLKSGAAIHEMQHIYTREHVAFPVRFDASVMPAEQPDGDELAVLYAVHTRVAEDVESVLQEQYRYRYILDNLDVAYCELDEQGKFYFSDKYSLYEISRESPTEILKDSGAYEGIYPDDLPILFQFFALKKANMPKVSVTLRMKMRDGSYRWTQMMGFFEYDENGRRVKSIGVLRDVDTEWQNQNRKLQEALDAAEKANRTKTDFLARMSHEMRTPLNGILGLTELMRDLPDERELAQDVEELRQSGSYLLELINDTLDVSTIEQGKMQLHPIVCDGRTAFENVIAMVRPGMKAKHIQFTMKADNLPFTKLYIDVGRVEQAVINVLGNAVKFTPENGEIVLEMKNISQENGIITDELTIRDTGIGMSREFVEHLFEPFTQEHGDSCTTYHGTGLGMTIARQCVELMGGSVTVDSELGKGTCVTMVLPMPEATPEQLGEWNSVREKGDLAILRGKRVLLCEDHPLNAKIAIRLLEKKGMKVEHAENGRIGVELFATSTPGYYAAVLMDIRMPVMDGLEAARRIRALQRRDARWVPIVAMTANAMQEDVRNSLNAGMTEHLGKPVEPERLYRTLAELIEHPNPAMGQKILVVDDIEMNRDIVRKAIGNIYTVLEAGNGEDALAVLNREKDIAGVVTDLQMPVMDGKELICRIRAEHRFDHVAILANTIYGNHRQEEELLALGANDFLYKPSSPQIIIMRLEHIMRTME